MPNYRTLATVTAQNRRAVYQGICSFLDHLEAFDVTLLSLVYNTRTQRLDIVTINAIPQGQLTHLGIEES